MQINLSGLTNFMLGSWWTWGSRGWPGATTIRYAFMEPGADLAAFYTTMRVETMFGAGITLADFQSAAARFQATFEGVATAFGGIIPIPIVRVTWDAAAGSDPIDGIQIEIGAIEFGTKAATWAFSDPPSSSAAALAYTPRATQLPNPVRGDIWFGTNRGPWTGDAPDEGNHGWWTALHEFGHALGISHPFSGNDHTSSRLPGDTTRFTVMSYRGLTGGAMSQDAPSAPMLLDILMLQRLYGANPTTRTGADWYRFETINEWPIQAIWDAGGHDTIDGTDQDESLTIDLNPGGQSFVDDQRGTNPEIHLAYTPQVLSNELIPDWIDSTAWVDQHLIEDALGGGGDDVIIGNRVDNLLFGNSGEDKLFGGLGNDTLMGGADSDTLYGDIGVDIYDFETSAVRDRDTIIDGDGGRIRINGVLLTGIATYANDPARKGRPAWTIEVGGSSLLLVLTSGDLATGATIEISGGTLGQGVIVINHVIADNEDLTQFGFSLSGDNSIESIDGPGSFLEGGANTVDVKLAGAVTGGRRQLEISLLNGAALAPFLRVVNGAETLQFQNGRLLLWVEDGATSLNFSVLTEGDVDLDQSFSLAAQLLDEEGEAEGDSAELALTFDSQLEDETFGNEILGDQAPLLDENEEIIYDQWGNIIPDGLALDRWDIIRDTPGNDRISGGGGRDLLDAWRGGNDILIGGHEDDIADGRGGDDRIFGDAQLSVGQAIELGRTQQGDGGYADFLQGRAGNDLVVGSNGRDLVSGGAGDDLLIAGAGDDLITGDQSYVANFTGLPGGWDWGIDLDITSNGDGTTYTYTVVGATLVSDGAPAGNDTIYAGNGDDGVLAGSGNDLVLGEAGNDILFGEGHDDTLLGGAGDDRLDGDDPEDVNGRDFLDGGDGNDNLQGAGNEDTLFGGAGNDVLAGDDGNEFDGDDYLNGEDGNDRLIGGGGSDELFGGAGNDELYGEGSDTPEDLIGDDYMDGGDGDDLLVGSGGADQLVGGIGNDQLFGDSSDTDEQDLGDDFLDGGEGEDILSGGGGADILLGGADDDDLYGESTDTPESAHGADYLDGGAGDDTLLGAGGGDILLGGDGDDQMVGDGGSTPTSLHGDDTLDGGAGNDNLYGDGGSDILIGGEGNDLLAGEQSSTPVEVHGDDTLDGGEGNDTLYGFGGLDTLEGGDGNDTLSGGDGDDVANGGSGVDQVFGGAGNDFLDGGQGDDIVSGNDGDDYITGGEGFDLLFGGAGDDVLDGGGGRDTYSYSLGNGADSIYDSAGNTLQFGFAYSGVGFQLGVGSLRLSFSTSPGDEIHIAAFDPEDPHADPVIDTFVFTDRTMTYAQVLALGFDLDGTPNSDVIEGTALADRIDALASDDDVYASGGDDIVDGGEGNDYILAGEGNDNVIGGLGSDFIHGGGGSDSLNAGEGDDLVEGAEGEDSLDGGSGADIMLGGAGDDTFMVESAGDVVEELTDEGYDQVDSTISYTLTANVERLRLFGTAVLGIGNELSNNIEGNAQDNFLDGGAGADVMAGGSGSDTYVVDDSDDQIFEINNPGMDLVLASASYTLSTAIENLTLTGSDAVDGTGNLAANVITGNSNDNIIDGDSGADTLIGGAGNDTYVVDDANDVVTELANEGTDTVISSVSHVLGATLEHLTLTGFAAINGTGNAGNNHIAGNDGDNRLDGGAGSDTLTGGMGGDTYIIDNTGDVIIDDQMFGQVDVVEASVNYTLGEQALVERYEMTGGSAINVTGNSHTTQYQGNAADNIIVDVAGNDWMFGNGGSDTLIAGDDANRLDGGTGVDHLEGGGGDDLYVVDETTDVIVEGVDAGYDYVVATANYTLSANLEDLEIQGAVNGTGNALGNNIYGSELNNVIAALGGDDSILSGGGNDIVDAGDGDDLIEDTQGVNTLTGGSGNDTYRIFENVTTTIVELAGGGTDTVVASANHVMADNVEILRLAADYDNYDGVLTAQGNSLDNTITGSDFDNQIAGLGGNDDIDGRSGNDLISGGAGNDIIVGGEDRVGAQNDGQSGLSFVFELRNDDTLSGGDGDDDIDGQSGNDVIMGDAGNDTLYGGDDQISQILVPDPYGYGYGYGYYTDVGLTNDDEIAGGAGNDTIDGGSGSDFLEGGDGTDTLIGGADGTWNFDNDDTLDGGAGIDTMSGGTGNDTYHVDGTFVTEADPTAVDHCELPIPGATRRIWTTDLIVENEGEGFDTVHSSASIVLPAHFEEVRLTGADHIDATSGAGSQIIVGNAGNNRLDGGAGADDMTGGQGDDTYVLSDAGDVITELAGEGTDTVVASFNFTLGSSFENLTLSGAAISGVGNSAANRLVGNAAANLLYGGAGNDELNGGAGDDVLQGQEGDDVYRYGVGSGNDTVYDGSGLNTVRLIGDLDAGDLSVSLVGNDVVVTLIATGETLTLMGWGSDPAHITGNLRLCVCGCPVQFNSAPVAQPDTANLTEDTVLTASGSVLTNDSDPDEGTVLTVVNARTVVGAFGTLVLNADGSYLFTLDNVAVQPLAVGETRQESFDYMISDNDINVAITDTSTLAVTVTGINDGPVAVDDSGSVVEDGTVTATGNALGNDSDIDQGDALEVSNPGTQSGTYGSMSIAGNGDYTYTLANASSAVQSLGQGETELDTFGYNATDGIAFDGGLITISIAGANDAPILVTPLSDRTGTEGQELSFAVPASAFTDIDRNDSLTLSATLADGSALPSWLTFDAITRQFSGTPPTGSSGTYQVRVTATDLFTASANDVFDVIIGSTSQNTIPWTPTTFYPPDPSVEKWKSRSGYVVNGYKRSDAIYVGGAGFDVLVGTDGNDAILMQDPSNPWTGPSANPRVVGIERVDAGDGNDIIDMGSTLFSGPPMTLDGGAGNDLIAGSTSATVMFGGTGDDQLQGYGADDVLDGGQGGDFMAGGAGNDTYYADHDDDSVYDAAGGGIDTIYSSASFGLAGVSEIEYLVLTGTANSEAYGNGFAQTITGNSGDNYIVGGGGADTLIGGEGDDTYFVETLGASIVELPGGGFDTVQTTVSYTLDAGVENLRLKAWDPINGSGNELDNFIFGNSSENTLQGFGGNDLLNGGEWGDDDVLIGGTGNDTYIVDSTGDVVVENANEGFDIVYSDKTGDMAANIEVLFMTGYRDIDSNGNALSNLMRGTLDGNVLTGGGGIDVLEGGQGWDTLIDTTGDSNGLLNGGQGTDSLTGSSARELFIGGEWDDTISTGGGADIILFNQHEGHDTILGGSGGQDDILSLGWGIEYEDIELFKSGNDLILKTGAGNSGLTFSGWYADPSNRNVGLLQVVVGESFGYDPQSSDPLRNQRVQVFDFAGMVGAYDAARAANPQLTGWAINSALTTFHLTSSSTAAYGGDLAYGYGLNRTMSDISFASAIATIGSSSFGTGLQTLQGPSLDSTPRLT